MGCVGCILPLLISKASWYAAWESSTTAVYIIKRNFICYWKRNWFCYKNNFFGKKKNYRSMSRWILWMKTQNINVLINIDLCMYVFKLTVSCFSCGNFSQIPVVITFHFKVEYLTFWITSLWNQIFVQKTLFNTE